MEWVTALEAIEALGASSLHARSSQAEAICKRAYDGLVRSRARLFCRTRGKQEQRQENAPLPERFWWPKGQAALEQDWQRGDFSSWPSWLGGNEEWRAFGVEFASEDIEAMGGDFNGKAATSASRHNGAGRKLSKHWPLFVAELALWIEEANDDPKVMTSGKLIDKLNERLAAKGIEDMPRATADDTVKAVLSALQASA